MNEKDLSERDICSKFISPAVKRAGGDGMMQIREKVAFTKGRIIVRGKLVTRGKAKRADYILYYKPNIRSLSLRRCLEDLRIRRNGLGSKLQCRCGQTTSPSGKCFTAVTVAIPSAEISQVKWMGLKTQR